MRIVGRRGDRQHLADRLDPIRLPMIVEERDHGFTRRSSSARAKYADALRRILVRLSKLSVLALQRLQLLGHIGRNASPLAAIDVRLLHPIQKRLRRAADLGRNRNDRRPSRRMLMFVVQHQPHRTGTDLRRKLVACLIAHGSTLSRVGASGKPGAVHGAQLGILIAGTGADPTT